MPKIQQQLIQAPVSSQDAGELYNQPVNKSTLLSWYEEFKDSAPKLFASGLMYEILDAAYCYHALENGEDVEDFAGLITQEKFECWKREMYNRIDACLPLVEWEFESFNPVSGSALHRHQMVKFIVNFLLEISGAQDELMELEEFAAAAVNHLTFNLVPTINSISSTVLNE